MMNLRLPALLALAAAGIGLAGCSNFPSRSPQVWIWDDMKKQPKYKSQLSSPFFADGRASRRPVEGTVSEEGYRADESRATGVAAGNVYVARNPQPLTRETLLRGQAKFNVYCAPCHDRTGSGRGIVALRSGWLPGNLVEDRIAAMVDGEIFHVATMGRRTMPGYRFQVSDEDRWAIVAYVRALQRARRATINDVPAGLQAKVR
jgi:mono/diheme cytochrome c family protein